ncbi:leucine-rich repeat domain-containing protein [Paenibacillus sp. 19GGS1-52]|uniref:leucine-rich repeat domain-containing protein n=1 Tax=Paenibacillus sp. 19GGS1-52 TaxID=2758563 RepID=UPI001EFB6BD2|nr:leucine-rich repeat domain-containing protein [Paenibacillus sp. 19GGS1-52]ULO07406.1 leucine-rich repeat domain-containing protein [Paenibacillus sp. 19GGS1-52]
MKTLIAKMLVSLLLVTAILPIFPTTNDEGYFSGNSVVSAESSNDIANFPDPALNQAVAIWLGKSVTETVYKADIIAKLPTAGYTFSANSKGISDLTGIEIFEGTGVTYLDLGRNNITELNPIKNIVSLQQLNIESNKISDLSPISSLTSIKALAVNSNQIEDITPTRLLGGLTSLNIANNKVTDLSSLAGLMSEVAARRHLEIWGMRSNNPHIRKANKESSYAIDRLHSSLNETQRELYGLMEEATNTEKGFVEEEAFVVGFLEGYRFIKELQRSGGGLTLV